MKIFSSILSALLCCLLCCGSCVVFGSSENWVEVARFSETGFGTTTTETFECSHIDWRINWSFESRVDPPPTLFMITVYDSNDKTVDTFLTAFEGNGTLNYNATGSFYLTIRVNYVKNYQITVEQNINSIPEVPSWLILPIFLVCSFCVILLKKKLYSNR